MTTGELAKHLEAFARRWGVDVERVMRSSGSYLGFGTKRGEPVVLKVVGLDSDEARLGSVVSALAGPAMVRVHEWEHGAALLERLRPGTPLAELVRAGRDLDSTRVLADVIGALHEEPRPTGEFTTAEAWGRSFERYRARDDQRLPRDLVDDAAERYARLCATQNARTLLHGDLQHHNVLMDGARGWVAIDPKGVVAELAFELGAALRNPWGVAEMYSSTASAERRIDVFSRVLPVDSARVAEWSYAQAVLSAIWTLEDEGTVRADHAGLQHAAAIRPLLD